MKKPKIKTQKPKIKTKIKSKDRVKINKQNQNVKVHIKIGNDGKTVDHRKPNSITTYPLLENAQPPINIITNHENRHPPLAPVHVPIAPVNPIVPMNPVAPIAPLHVPTIATPIKRKINIRRKLRKVDEIPTPTNYESDDSISKFYGGPSPNFEYKKSDISDDDSITRTVGRSLFNREKVLNPMTNRMVYQDSKTYRDALKRYNRIHNR